MKTIGSNITLFCSKAPRICSVALQSCCSVGGVQLAIAAPGEDCNLPAGEAELQRAAAVKYEGHKSLEHETWGRAADCRQNTREHASIRRSHEDFTVKLLYHCLQATYGTLFTENA